MAKKDLAAKFMSAEKYNKITKKLKRYLASGKYKELNTLRRNLSENEENLIFSFKRICAWFDFELVKAMYHKRLKESYKQKRFCIK